MSHCWLFPADASSGDNGRSRAQSCRTERSRHGRACRSGAACRQCPVRPIVPCGRLSIRLCAHLYGHRLSSAPGMLTAVECVQFAGRSHRRSANGSRVAVFRAQCRGEPGRAAGGARAAEFRLSPLGVRKPCRGAGRRRAAFARPVVSHLSAGRRRRLRSGRRVPISV